MTSRTGRSDLVAPAETLPDENTRTLGTIATTTYLRSGQLTPVVAIADGRTALVATNSRSNEFGEGVVVDDSPLIAFPDGLFESVLRPTSSVLSVSADQPSFPYRTASIRQCIWIRNHCESRLKAIVHGRDVHTGDSTTVAGEIDGTRVESNEPTISIRREATPELCEVGGRTATAADVSADVIIHERT